MTSNRSAKKPNFFLHNAAEKLRTCLPLLIIISLSCIIASTIITVGAFKSVRTIEINFNFFVVAEMFYGFSFFTAMAATFVYLRQTWKRTAADMEYSVPLGKREKLFSDLSAAAFMNIAPFLFSCFIMLAGFIIGYAKYEGKVVVPETEHTNEVVSHLFGDLLGQLGLAVLAGISLIILTVSLVFFIAAGSGKIEELFMYTVLFCVIIPTGMQAVPEIMKNYSLSDYSTGVSLIYCTSPITGFLQVNELANLSTPASVWADCIITMLVTAVIFAVPAYFIYMRRRAEQTGTVLTSRPILAVFEFTVMLLGVSYTLSTGQIIFLALLFVPIIILETIYNIKRPAVKKSIIKIVSMAALIALFIGIANATNKFGAVTRIPSAQSIESVYIQAFDVDADITAPEEIEKIREFQGDLIDFYLDNKADVNEYYNYRYKGYALDEPDIHFFGDANIKYTLKNGKTTERKYFIDYDNYYKYVSEIPRLDSVVNAKAEDAYKNISESSGKGIFIRTGNMLQEGAAYDLDGVSDEYIARLAEAVRTDIINETTEQYTHRSVPVYSISAFFSNVSVYTHYTNTTALLDEITGKIEPKAELMTIREYFAVKTPDESKTDFDFKGIFFNRSVDIRYGYDYGLDANSDVPVISIGYLRDTLSEAEYSEVESIAKELIEHSYSFYVGEDNVTVLRFDWYSSMLIVPEEYSQMAVSLEKYEVPFSEYFDWYEKQSYVEVS